MINTIVWIINFASTVLLFMVLLNVFLPYFLPPGYVIRMNVDRVVEPLLNLIRKYVPSIGRIDLSPVILVVIIQLLTYLLIRLISSLAG